MYDVVVIGAGPGGYVSAIRAAELGLHTAIVDRDPTLGGTCLNVGCIPSKSLLHSSELYKKGDFPQMMEKKRAVVKSLTDTVASQMKQNKIEWLKGEAQFLDPHTLQVGKERIEAKNFVIATGSEPISLPFLPFDEKKILSSTGALSLAEIPQTMVVIGGGYIGVELASVYRRLGTDVTIVERLDHICPGFDRGVGREFLKILKKQGLKFLLSTQVVRYEGGALTLEGEANETLSPDVILVSIGRRPYTKSLGLSAVGIQPDKRGFIPVDGSFRTSVPHIYAIGDVIGGLMLAHKASEEGVAAAEIIAGHHPTVRYITVPGVVYTHPEVAAVGWTEEEAKNLGIAYVKGISYFKGNARARCQDETEGFVKILAEEKSRKIIGLHIIGAHASEMICVGQVALDKGATLEEIGRLPFAHPTLSEAIKEAASLR